MFIETVAKTQVKVKALRNEPAFGIEKGKVYDAVKVEDKYAEFTIKKQDDNSWISTSYTIGDLNHPGDDFVQVS